MALRYLFIAEKPSLMREVQSCYNKNKNIIEKKVGQIGFCALSGHVCADYTPDDYEEWADVKWKDADYPIKPSVWKIKAMEGKSNLLANVEKQAKNYDGVIVGTDSDVEGYGIYWKLEQYLGLGYKPALRFIEHSLTEKEILQSLLTMTDFHEDPAHISATNAYLVRSRADWLFGMNCTRIMTVKKGTLLKVGRVKAATLGIVYQNSMEIENFKPEPYFQVKADYGSFYADLLDEKRKAARFPEKPDTSKYPLKGIVTERKTKKVRTHAPQLFDLTAIQAEAGRAFHYSPSKTLDLVQSLYEKHKVISYPRTQCRFVSSEKAKEFQMMLTHMIAFPDLARAAERVTSSDIERVMQDSHVVNDAEVELESHDALLPTSIRANPSAMTADEQNICHMIYARFLAQFLPEAKDNKTDLIIKHGSGEFGISGKQIIEQGWRVLFKEGKDVILPDIKEGDEVTAKQITAIKKMTTPPKRLTQATLINAMQNIANVIEDKALKQSLAESKGIGTPATRASIIRELFTSGYMEERKTGIYITDLGKTYIQSLDGIDITSPVFAAKLDMEMKKVQYGKESYEDGFAYVESELDRVCSKMLALKTERYHSPVSSGTKNGNPNPKSQAVINKINPKYLCPYCGNPMLERMYSFACQEQDCGFSINKKIAGVKISQKLMKQLAEHAETEVREFQNKEGKRFRAKLALSPERKIVFKFEHSRR